MGSTAPKVAPDRSFVEDDHRRRGGAVVRCEHTSAPQRNAERLEIIRSDGRIHDATPVPHLDWLSIDVIEHGARHEASKWHLRAGGSRQHSRDGAQARRQFVGKTEAARLRISRSRQADLERQRVLRIEAQTGGSQMDHIEREQSTRAQQHHGERDLSGRQRVLQALLAGAGGDAGGGFLQSVQKVEPQRVNRGSKTEDDRRKRGRRAREG